MRRLAIAPLLLTAAACGTNGSPAAAPGPVPSTQPAATTPATTPATPPPTTPATPAPSATRTATKPPVRATPPAKAPVTTPPATPAPKPAARNDVDGDGRADTVRLTERRDSPTTGLWSMTVTLAAGGTVDGTVHAEPNVRPEILGVADADRDGDGEVFVRVGGGASTTSYTPYTLVEDGMAEVRTNDGKPLRLLAGGTVTHGDGFSCADVSATAGRELVVLSVVSDRGTTFQGTRRTYRWSDDRVTLLSTRSFTGEQGDPAVEKSYEIDCDGLQQG